MKTVNKAVRKHLTMAVTKKLRAARDAIPDTLSTDYNANSRSTGVIDLPNVMSKFLLLGVPMDQVVAMVTSNAAKVFPAFGDRGTLNVGAPADVAVMELRQGNFEFLDNYGGKRSGQQRLFPIETVIGGKRAARVLYSRTASLKRRRSTATMPTGCPPVCRSATSPAPKLPPRWTSRSAAPAICCICLHTCTTPPRCAATRTGPMPRNAITCGCGSMAHTVR